MSTTQNISSQTDYSQFLVEIKERIHRSRYEAAKTVNCVCGQWHSITLNIREMKFSNH
ncbi:MAG: hypothetical protein LBS01_11550 [Prevotellaceae bacterium]|jgi:hypothetical protein|nr:hypothetical protein [Prevotellaceae bacterium]